MVNLIKGKADKGRHYVSDVTNPPTDAEIDALTGFTPADVEVGFFFFIDDSNSDNTYIVVSNGTNWFYSAMTKAA